jgi:hypothetical protein
MVAMMDPYEPSGSTGLVRDTASPLTPRWRAQSEPHPAAWERSRRNDLYLNERQPTTSFGSMAASRNHRLKRMTHLFGGLIILMHAYDRLEHGHATWWVFVLAGGVFLSVALLHAMLVKRWPYVDIVFFVIEAMLSFVVMGECFHAGKRGLPYMYMAAGVLQLVGAVVHWRRARH